MTYRPATAADVDRIGALAQLAFNVAFDPARFDVTEARVLDVDGQIPAVAKINRFGHYHGGRAVDAGGVGMVAVAAEARGRGHGTAIMRGILHELHDAGVPISTLFPATLQLYRSCGYGAAAHWTRWKSRLDALPTSAPLRAETLGTEQHEELFAAYDRLARTQEGLIVRPPQWWERRVLTAESPHRYVVREDDRITGWIVYGFGQRPPDGWLFPLRVQDLHWETADAARTLLALAAAHRSTASDIHWIGPHDEPLMSLTHDHAVEIVSTFRLMVRLVDVPGALEARGYPTTVDAAITIGVHDDVLPGNAGPWRLEVRDGSAKVAPAPGQQADATADVATWGSVWTGLYRARDAARIGGLQADARAIAALESIFAGPTPWVGDFF